ncbi:hypothetical protein HYPSUDRAFT_59564 [Hypholoma sublateritium FD-334 SS-4]|uniref:Uncharacterized protein n=1 Tax=Hypholoma sublateritium (strain FD-334 SS-4) TaxID=945553 RepID=A0A0D2KHJ1_HYPSF|nr:hypothetical protein HYPSUDRAFT_59564 [Hypholoma sublateritium FD-334 SS-4]
MSTRQRNEASACSPVSKKTALQKYKAALKAACAFQQLRDDIDSFASIETGTCSKNRADLVGQNLGKHKPEGNFFRDCLQSLQKRAFIEPRVPVIICNVICWCNLARIVLETTVHSSIMDVNHIEESQQGLSNPTRPQCLQNAGCTALDRLIHALAIAPMVHRYLPVGDFYNGRLGHCFEALYKVARVLDKGPARPRDVHLSAFWVWQETFALKDELYLKVQDLYLSLSSRGLRKAESPIFGPRGAHPTNSVLEPLPSSRCRRELQSTCRSLPGGNKIKAIGAPSFLPTISGTSSVQFLVQNSLAMSIIKSPTAKVLSDQELLIFTVKNLHDQPDHIHSTTLSYMENHRQQVPPFIFNVLKEVDGSWRQPKDAIDTFSPIASLHTLIPRRIVHKTNPSDQAIVQALMQHAMTIGIVQDRIESIASNPISSSSLSLSRDLVLISQTYLDYAKPIISAEQRWLPTSQGLRVLWISRILRYRAPRHAIFMMKCWPSSKASNYPYHMRTSVSGKGRRREVIAQFGLVGHCVLSLDPSKWHLPYRDQVAYLVLPDPVKKQYSSSLFERNLITRGQSTTSPMFLGQLIKWNSTY